LMASDYTFRILVSTVTTVHFSYFGQYCHYCPLFVFWSVLWLLSTFRILVSTVTTVHFSYFGQYCDYCPLFIFWSVLWLLSTLRICFFISSKFKLNQSIRPGLSGGDGWYILLTSLQRLRWYLVQILTSIVKGSRRQYAEDIIVSSR
jgi:hypothetical protein